jgi:putative two-component system response regulator
MTERTRVERILVVDGEPRVRAVAARILREAGYRCDVARAAAQARRAIGEFAYDLMLCDVRLPDHSALDLIEGALASDGGMTVLVMTGMPDVALADEALVNGAYGYVVKPFTAADVLVGVHGALRHREHVTETTDQLRASREEMIHRLSIAVEARDPEVGPHVLAMSSLCSRIAHKLGLSPERCEQIRTAAAMHDVGKIAVPDRVLLKAGPLTSEERLDMERHAEIGYRILAGSRAELVQLAASIAWTHHEKFDGSGYPRGLTGEEIPLEGRIAAVADVFDALTRNRVYRPRLPIPQALAMLEEGRGTHFDPIVLDAFLADRSASGTIGHQASNGQPASNGQLATPGHQAGIGLQASNGHH